MTPELAREFARAQRRGDVLRGKLKNIDRVITNGGKGILRERLTKTTDETFLDEAVFVAEAREAAVTRLQTTSRPKIEALYDRAGEQIGKIDAIAGAVEKGTLAEEDLARALLIFNGPPGKPKELELTRQEEIPATQAETEVQGETGKKYGRWDPRGWWSGGSSAQVVPPVATVSSAAAAPARREELVLGSDGLGNVVVVEPAADSTEASVAEEGGVGKPTAGAAVAEPPTVPATEGETVEREAEVVTVSAHERPYGPTLEELRPAAQVEGKEAAVPQGKLDADATAQAKTVEGEPTIKATEGSEAEEISGQKIALAAIREIGKDNIKGSNHLQNILDILINAAENGQLLTYAEVAQKAGMAESTTQVYTSELKRKGLNPYELTIESNLKLPDREPGPARFWLDVTPEGRAKYAHLVTQTTNVVIPESVQTTQVSPSGEAVEKPAGVDTFEDFDPESVPEWLRPKLIAMRNASLGGNLVALGDIEEAIIYDSDVDEMNEALKAAGGEFHVLRNEKPWYGVTTVAADGSKRSTGISVTYRFERTEPAEDQSEGEVGLEASDIEGGVATADAGEASEEELSPLMARLNNLDTWRIKDDKQKMAIFAELQQAAGAMVSQTVLAEAGEVNRNSANVLLSELKDELEQQGLTIRSISEPVAGGAMTELSFGLELYEPKSLSGTGKELAGAAAEMNEIDASNQPEGASGVTGEDDEIDPLLAESDAYIAQLQQLAAAGQQGNVLEEAEQVDTFEDVEISTFQPKQQSILVVIREKSARGEFTGKEDLPDVTYLSTAVSIINRELQDRQSTVRIGHVPQERRRGYIGKTPVKYRFERIQSQTTPGESDSDAAAQVDLSEIEDVIGNLRASQREE